MEKLPKNHFRYLLLFVNQSNGSISSLEAAKKICSVYGRSAISEKTCKRWLKNFEKGDFNLDDHPKSGRKRKICLDFLKEKVEKQPKTTRKLVEEFKCDPKTKASIQKIFSSRQRSSSYIKKDPSCNKEIQF